MKEMSEQYGLRVANVFHAGDGNLHPLILYDANKPGELERAEEFGAEILKLCVEVGGVLTGEHGVGVEKRDLMPAMFSEIDLNAQQRVKCAFDEKGLLNPGKVFPGAAPLRRTRPHAHFRRQAAVPGYSEAAILKVVPVDRYAWRSRHLKPRDAKEVEDAVRWALRQRQGAGSCRARHQARHRPPEPDRHHARSVRPHRRHAL